MLRKTLYASLLLAILAFSACRNCIECTKYPSANDTVDLCKKDYASDDSYSDAYRNLVADGYRCE
ncbi:MAG: hypothetical protein IPH78_06815 [Bacteroidetes bacterium]|nr:hypothetical protein [Bacteroidota bacterium]MBK8658153.1 hypothetical protein [Bacteroidota bacterium]